MKNQLLIKSDRCCVAHLTQADRWVRLVLSLATEYTGGELVRLAEHANVAIEGTDELSSTYTRLNWMSGLASGVLYAFRALRIPRQQSVLDELSGRLRASDMEAVARCSAIAVAALADRELPPFESDGWEIQVRVFARAEMNGSPKSFGDHVASTPASSSAASSA